VVAALSGLDLDRVRCAVVMTGDAKAMDVPIAE
jgi:hypothetical protein